MSESLFERYEKGERSQSHLKKYKKFECKSIYDDDYKWRQSLLSDEEFDSLFSQVVLYGSGTILFDL
jgi:hypothetical protein